MRPSRLPQLSSSFRLLPVRGAPINAFAFALALLAGVACDENAPTETRASRSQPGPVAEADLAASDISTSTIALPVNQNVSTVAPNPGFRVNQIGTGPNAIFQITRAGSTQAALQGLTNGRGRAGLFQITNTLNTQSALQAQTNGSGLAVSGLSTGTGGAGSFQVTNSTNPSSALLAQTNGNGSAGSFEINNVNSNLPALYALTNGSGYAVLGRNSGAGPAGRFETFNHSPNNDLPALIAKTYDGRGDAFEAFQFGAGRGGLFAIENPANGANALQVQTNGTGWALRVSGPSIFIGDVKVEGTLVKDAGSFRIDHPLDPEHKYLSHSFVESPDMKNVYDGTVTLDADGRATVELPDYFGALNRDFRYQLTAIGAPGPNLYIAQGVTQNRFRIAGGRPYAHVSWQVTGVRQDPYANEHRIKVEEEKPLEEQKPSTAGHLIARR
jgi:hypothetical protein